MKQSIYMRSVEHAAELAGGYDELASRLGVSTAEVIAWTAGARTPPTASFLRVLDCIMVETQTIYQAASARAAGER
jgi:hypothetical protein